MTSNFQQIRVFPSESRLSFASLTSRCYTLNHAIAHLSARDLLQRLLQRGSMASIIKVGTRWRAQVRRAGAKSSSKTFATKAAAEAWARKVEGQIDTGEYQAASGITVAQVIAAYRDLRERSGRPVADTANEHYQLRTLSDRLGTRRAEQMEVAHLVEFCQARRSEGAGPYTINMDVSKLGTVLRHTAAVLNFRAPDVVGMARPVLHHLGLIGGGGRRERRPTADELAGIFEYCAERAAVSPVFAALPDIIRLAIQVGLRRGEIFRLAWADLDAAKRLILVRDRKDPRKKEGNDQWVPLVGDALAIIQRQPRDDARIFPHHPQTVSKYFLEACRAKAIPDLHFHDMRHEAASALIEAGWSPHEARVVTGHKRSEHLDRYVNLDPSALALKPTTRPATESGAGRGTRRRPARGKGASSRDG
ncbi:tyrosine-type recombinase/integrase [Aromatoleum aromaticum]|nr:tyrosine-type recombinase/integrase [Aromatoleum aromaticum]